jgi:hypothetical protein
VLPIEVRSALGLETVQEERIFCLVFGYWLGDGTMALKRNGDVAYVTFSTYKDAVQVFEWLDLLGLSLQTDDRLGDYLYKTSIAADGVTTIHRIDIKHPKWVKFFGDEFWYRYGKTPGTRTYQSEAIPY